MGGKGSGDFRYAVDEQISGWACHFQGERKFGERHKKTRGKRKHGSLNNAGKKLVKVSKKRTQDPETSSQEGPVIEVQLLSRYGFRFLSSSDDK